MASTTFSSLLVVNNVKGMDGGGDGKDIVYPPVVIVALPLSAGQEVASCCSEKSVQVSYWFSTRTDILVLNKPSGTLRTSGTGLLFLPRFRTKHGEAVFKFHSEKIWNSLPD